MKDIELFNDHFQNYKVYGIPKAQLVIADIPYNVGDDAYGSNPMWCNGGDNKNGLVCYGTGIAVEIPQGYVGLVFPRSSIANTHLALSNSVGVIDSGYRGEIKAKFRKGGTRGYNVGDRIAQLIIIPYPEVVFEEAEELSDSDRGTGGYGSSGR